MTDPAGGAPNPQAPAPPPVAPPPAGGNWQAPPPAGAGMPGGFNPNFNPAPVEAGPAPGVVYADLVTRIIALFIDGIILGVVYFVLMFVAGIFIVATHLDILGLFFGVIWAVASAVYYIYCWTRMRASYGQKFLKLETVSAADGATLTQDQAIRRWAFLWGPAALGMIIPILGVLISLAASIYMLYLLYTANQSPKRQGLHDVQAGTVVVKHV